MEELGYTLTQTQRLTELGAPEGEAVRRFADTASRDTAFREAERQLIARCREHLLHCVDGTHEVALVETSRLLCEWLTREEGFTQVATPTIITAEALDKMTITEGHPLREQIYWLDGKRCLRPMLAPNLYVVMRDLSKAVKKPVRIFETGSCFRKETKGSRHLSEFTMLNLVEYATVREGEQKARLEELAQGAMRALGISEFELVRESSDVYIETLDIEVGGIEVASGSFGPHPLDDNWGVFTTWVGLGIGVERAAMARTGVEGIKRLGRSTGFVDGTTLKL